MAEQSQTSVIRLVTFVLDGQRYGVDVKLVREILDSVDLSPTVHAPHYVKGLLNLRGASVPVVSLRRRFGLPEQGDSDAACIAVIEHDRALCGFLFDDIADVIRIKRRDISPLLDSAARPWLSGIVDMGHQLGMVLNLHQLA